MDRRLSARKGLAGGSRLALPLGLALMFALAVGFSGSRSAFAQGRGAPAASARSNRGTLEYTNKRSFRIPFDIDKEGRSKIKDVQLYVSEDTGGHWNPGSRVTPDRPSFTFRASHDGEFWFAVRILGIDGQLYPSANDDVVPGMKVLVDTKPPTLDLEPEGRRGTEAAVRWEVHDENLDLKSLIIEYQAEGVREWSKVPIKKAALIGSQRWDLGTADAVKVRATVADKAGNETVAKISLGDGSASLPESSAENREEFAPPLSIGQVPDSAGIKAGPGFGPVGDEPEEQRPRSVGVGRVKNSSTRSRPQTRLSQAAPASGSTAFDQEQPVGGNGGREPMTSGPAAVSSVFDSLPASQGTAVAPAAMNPGQSSSVFGAPNGAGMASQAEAPAGNPSEPLLVASSRFSLKYEVEDAGPNGPATVELWVTRDGGRTWIPRGGDLDRTSPIEVDLGGDGNFGIRLVSRSAFGLGDQPPGPGDPPDRWIVVDSAAPLVQLYPIVVGTGTHAGKIAIKWRATDPHLAPRSTRLLWRPDQQGAPWQPIVEGQEGSGQFVWAVPPGIPGKFHVRVEAADTVGQLGSAETTETGAILVDRSRPKSRITGLVLPEARAGSMNSPTSTR